MKINSVQHFIAFIIILTSAGISAAAYDHDTIFPTPSILTGNVAFWMKIYTEIPMNQGLLHDRDFPLVIFEKITAVGSSQTVKNHRNRIADAINRINSEPRSQWTDLEHTIFDLYKRVSDSTAVVGAAERIRFQQGQLERFKEGLRRSGLYIDTIRSILRHHNVPLRLAYLPHVESSFNTEAYSKVGAAGLWQFMRGTGKLYGMQIDYTIDERRDPVIATTAAAKYLSSSFAQLGTWPLAITSYNHGVYGMKRAVAQTGSRDLAVIIQNYKSRSFQFASSNFYGCFLAASYVAENHARFFPDVILHQPMLYTDFTISHYITADDFCTMMGVSPEQLMHLNPAVRPAVFSKHQQLPKGFVLHIPGTRPFTELAAKYEAIPDSLKKTALPRPQYYRVNKGDNLYAIASRLGVPVADLAYENNISKRNRIRAGQVLRIPAKAVSAAATVVASTTPPPATVQVAHALPDTLPDTATQIAAILSGLPPSEKTSSNEAVMEIAQAEEVANLPPEEIAQAPQQVIDKKGQVEDSRPGRAPSKGAVVQKPAGPVPPPAASFPITMSDSLKEIAFAPAIADSAKKGGTRPRVAAGFDVAIYNLDAVLSPVGTTAKITVSIDETIGHYADWLGIPTWRIRKLNDMGRQSTINVNRSILLPIGRPDALEQFAAARLEYHMAIEEDFYGQYTVGEVNAYKLKRGETLWDICNNSENPLPLWLLSKYNQHVNLTKLYAGSEVWVPQVRELTGDELQSINTPDFISLPPPQPLRMRSQKSKIIP